MHLFQPRYSQLLLLIVLWMAARPLALAESSARGPAKVSPAAGLEKTTPSQLPEAVEPPAQSMPDEGPRFEGQSQGIDALAWQEGLAAYQKQRWTEARRFFEQIVAQYPDSSLAASAHAFLVELSLRQDASGRSRPDGIQAYKKLIRNYPQSLNARRAEWRIADLYLEQGWLQEAQAAYEQAMAHSLHLPFDGARALLGLGNTFMAMRKWNDAEHAFVNLRKRSDHDLLLQPATIGLAHALFRQRRLTEAQAFYDLSYRRWSQQFRMDPLALQRYATTQVALHHEASARELLIVFYNLYPRHEFAATALLHIADSLLATSRAPQAEFFYGLIPSLYPKSDEDTIAHMRLATSRADRMLPAGENWVGLTVSAMIHNAPNPDQNEVSFRAELQTIAIQHADDPIGTEALFHLGKVFEKTGNMSQSLLMYKQAALRSGRVDDPWPLKASERLSTVLKPWMEAALQSHDDLTVVSLFHRHGPIADQLYANSPLLLEIADAHRRLGFSLEAVRLYQPLTKSTKTPALLEPSLVGLSQTYLDQQDPQAARKVLERYRFQFPTGRYETEVLQLLVTAMQQQGDLQGLLHLCRNWLLHHPRHQARSRMYLQLATTLGQLEKYDDSALAYEEAFKAGAIQSSDRLLAYADTLSRLNRHEQAIAAYHAVLGNTPTTRQTEWVHLQTAKHWNALKQYDRATVALAELGETDDQLINRFSTSYKGSLQAARRPVTGEGL